MKLLILYENVVKCDIFVNIHKIFIDFSERIFYYAGASKVQVIDFLHSAKRKNV